MSYPFNEVTAVFLLNSPRYHHTSHSDEPLSYHDYLCHHDSPPPTPPHTPAHNLVILTVLHGAIGPSVRLAHGALKIILILILILIYIYTCQDGGAVGFVGFTKLSFALSSLAQPFDQM